MPTSIGLEALISKRQELITEKETMLSEFNSQIISSIGINCL